METTGDIESPGGCVVLVPIKAFAQAKRRLAPALGPTERAELAKTMAAAVLEAASPLPTAVVCDDDEVATWARQRGAFVVQAPGIGLNNAVSAGVSALASVGVHEVIVAHGDLPFASGLAALAGFDGVTLVPDRRHDGTNVLCVPANAGFVFRYGAGSFARHREETAQLGLGLRLVEAPNLAWDVDVPADLETTDGAHDSDAVITPPAIPVRPGSGG